MLELRGVSRRVGGVTHLADVSLRLERGTINVLLGPTLSGKTSLMRVMAGLDRPSAERRRVAARSLVLGADHLAERPVVARLALLPVAADPVNVNSAELGATRFPASFPVKPSRPACPGTRAGSEPDCPCRG